MNGGPGEAWQLNWYARECFRAIVACRKSIIGAINFPALGVGLAIAASYDSLMESEDASLGLPEVFRSVRRHALRPFGHSKTRRMMLTGERISGSELALLGIHEAFVPKDE